MKKKYLGDSYDIVKQSFLGWLDGDWSVHPMLTEEVDDQWINAYKAVLGGPKIKIISSHVPFRTASGGWYSVCNVDCNLFLDPHTGLTLRDLKKQSHHLTSGELVEIVKLARRKGFLTMVFDQSIDHDGDLPRQQVREKLEDLKEKGVYAFAYVSHSCVVVASDNGEVTLNALNEVLANSGVPGERFIKF